MNLALSYPDKILKIAVLDISPVGYAHNVERQIAAMRSIDLSSVFRRSDAENFLIGTLTDLDLATFFACSLTTYSKNCYHWHINLKSISEHIEEISSLPFFANKDAFETETLFLSGDQSIYIMPHHIAEIDGLFHNACIKMIKSAGHWLHFDNPENVTRHLTTFFTV